jgi:hypothetical protein
MVAASGCQMGSSGPSNQADAPAAVLSLKGEDLLLPRLDCAQNTTCPAAVGELVTYSSLGVRYCTASLVAPDLVLTASHCVPWENVTRANSVIGGCWVRWPAAKGNENQGEIIPCSAIAEASVLSARAEDLVMPDFAFVRLRRPSSRKALPIQARTSGGENPKIHESIVLYGVTPDAPKHLIRRHECIRDDAFPLMVKKAQPGQTLIMPGCPAELGHSGGPLLANDGAILGVMSLIEFRDPTSNSSSGAIAIGTRVSLGPLPGSR